MAFSNTVNNFENGSFLLLPANHGTREHEERRYVTCSEFELLEGLCVPIFEILLDAD
jgi:hypothetical protein